uniref:Uncharacterized protein n=1 Tax=Ditylenchus dipsaci TaxID=166011 RepID=A0A915EPA8_9BILA
MSLFETARNFCSSNTPLISLKPKLKLITEPCKPPLLTSEHPAIFVDESPENTPEIKLPPPDTLFTAPSSDDDEEGESSGRGKRLNNNLVSHYSHWTSRTRGRSQGTLWMLNLWSVVF